MKKVFFFTALVLLPLLLYPITIEITNDTTTPLIATIYDNKADVMNVSVLYPKQSYKWMDSRNGASNYEDGPFTVVFTCKNGDKYGTVKHINDNFHVTARNAVGPRRCGK